MARTRTTFAASRQRALEIVERFDAGMTITELAGRYNLTYARVHQICTAPPRRKIRDKAKHESEQSLT